MRAGLRSRKVALLLPISAALVAGCAVPTSQITEQGASEDVAITSSQAPLPTEVSPETRAEVNDATTPIKLRIEFWDQSDARAVKDGGCALTPSSRWDDSISRGESITLVGPDDVELATTGFERGRYEKTEETNDDYWEKIPTKKVCTFKADFGEVPKVATYRLKYRGYGVSDLAVSSELIESYDGTFTVIFGGNVKD